MRYLGHTNTKWNPSSMQFKSHITQSSLLLVFLYLPAIAFSL